MEETRDENLKSLTDDVKILATDLKYSIGARLLFTGALLDRYINLVSAKYDVNRARMEILHNLALNGGSAKPSDLARMTFRSKQNIVQIMDGLEKDGLVRREPIGIDRRTRMVSITDKGVSLARNHLPELIEAANAAIPDLSGEEMKLLNSVIRKIIRRMKSLVESYENNNVLNMLK